MEPAITNELLKLSIGIILALVGGVAVWFYNRMERLAKRMDEYDCKLDKFEKQTLMQNNQLREEISSNFDAKFDKVFLKLESLAAMVSNLRVELQNKKDRDA